MQHFKKFVKAIYDDFSLPWQVVVLLSVLAVVGTAVISAMAVGLAWLMCLLIDEPFVLKESLEPGMGLLMLVFFLIVIGDYLRQKWKSVNGSR